MSRMFRSCYAALLQGYVATRLPSMTVAEPRLTNGMTGDGPDRAGSVPSLARRFLALLADWILCLLAAGLIANPSRVAWPPVAILVLEYAFFVGLFGQTPGLRLARIRCVSIADGRPVGVLRGFVRGVLLALLVPALIMDRERRGLHDRAAGTVVVSADPPPPPAGPPVAPAGHL
jgi:uncharacterized RDD family membrane protein YckC